MRKGPFFGSLFVAVGAGVAFYFYFMAPASRSIQGYVMTRTDSPDVGIPNVPVDLHSASDPNFQRATQTNEKGWFSFPGLTDDVANGSYRVSAVLPNGASDEVANVSRGATVRLHPRKPMPK